MPIKCPQCGTENLDGALFCDDCGASLAPPAAAPSVPSESASPLPSAEASAAPAAAGAVKCPSCQHENPAEARFCENCGAAIAPTAPEAPPPPAQVLPVAALVLEGGLELPLDFSKGEVLVGRADPVSRVFPDVDLTPHGGYDAGVSRRHCRLTRQGEQYFVEDLGSTNGTKVNGQVIQPNRPYPLKDGDALELGLLRLTFKVRQGA